MPNCVVKADDFHATRSGKDSRWRKFLTLCQEEAISASLGFVARQSLKGHALNRELVDVARSECFQIWNHGALHWKSRNRHVTEFCGTSLQSQLNALKRCQKTCEHIFGRRPTAFGPPFNRYDVNTIRALRVMDRLDQVFDVAWIPGKTAIPKPYFVPCDGPNSNQRFSLDKAQRLSRAFLANESPFVLQIHPGNHWTDDCLHRFRDFVQWLRQAGVEFVFPHALFYR